MILENKLCNADRIELACALFIKEPGVRYRYEGYSKFKTEELYA